MCSCANAKKEKVVSDGLTGHSGKTLPLHMHACTRAHTHTHTHMHVRTSTHTQKHTHKHTDTYSHTHIHTHTESQTHTRTHSHSHTHTHTQLLSRLRAGLITPLQFIENCILQECSELAQARRTALYKSNQELHCIKATKNSTV